MNHNPSLGRTTALAASPVSIVLGVARLIETYRRYVRAGWEIEALLSLSDAQLAGRHLSRDKIGPMIFAKHGIDRLRSSDLCAS